MRFPTSVRAAIGISPKVNITPTFLYYILVGANSLLSTFVTPRFIGYGSITSRLITSTLVQDDASLISTLLLRLIKGFYNSKFSKWTISERLTKIKKQKDIRKYVPFTLV